MTKEQEKNIGDFLIRYREWYCLGSGQWNNRSPWFVIDPSSACPEAGHPGEIMGEGYETKTEAEAALIDLGVQTVLEMSGR